MMLHDAGKCSMMLSMMLNNGGDAEHGLRLNAGVYTGGRLGPLQIVAQYLKLHLYHQVWPRSTKFLHKLSGCVFAPLWLSEYSKVID